MGRDLPIPIGENPTFIHSLFSTFFFITLLFGSMFVISSLCGTLFSRRKKEETYTGDESDSKKNKDSSFPVDESPENNATTVPTTPDIDADQLPLPPGQQTLPPPPGRRQLGVAASYHVRTESSTSTASHKGKTDLASSLSMRVMGEKMKNLKEKNLKHEDSIWKKTIILGDKCKVPDEDDDDPIIYDEKGNRISTYHKKNANSMALSRQGSAIDLDALNNITNKGHNQNDESLIKQDEILK